MPASVILAGILFLCARRMPLFGLGGEPPMPMPGCRPSESWIYPQCCGQRRDNTPLCRSRIPAGRQHERRLPGPEPGVSLVHKNHQRMLAMTPRSSCFCSSDNADHWFSNSRCSAVRGTKSPSAKNSPRVIPKPSQSISSVETVGSDFLLKMCATVDWGRPDSLQSR